MSFRFQWISQAGICEARPSPNKKETKFRSSHAVKMATCNLTSHPEIRTGIHHFFSIVHFDENIDFDGCSLRLEPDPAK